VEPSRSSICPWNYQRSPRASRRVGVRVLGRIAAVAGHVGGRQGELFRYTSSRPRTDLRFPLRKLVTPGARAQTLRSVDGSSSLDLNRLRALTVGKIDSQARPPRAPTESLRPSMEEPRPSMEAPRPSVEAPRPAESPPALH